jgi:2-phosphosulfolactate phosphatase
MNFADQSPFLARCEWGLPALEHLAPAEIIIVVDVLSFSTCVEVATSRGARIFPWRWKDESAHEYAKEINAELAGTRDRFSGRYSLSPASLVSADPSLRLVLPSPNGSTLSLKARETGAIVVAGCLRNAAAIGAWLRAQRKSVTVIPAGERWPDGSVRHAIEDLIGAGAILSHFDTSRSPEAELAIAAYERFHNCLPETLIQASSGRELMERGFRADVELAATLDAGISVPILTEDGFQSAADHQSSIQPAAAADCAAIAELLQEAALWLRDQGRPLWNPGDFTEQAIFKELPAWHLARIGPEIVSVLKLENDDPFFWPDVPKNESLFLHKLVVRRAQAGTGLSSAMIAFAVAECRRRNKIWLRLDCDATRPKLRAIYESAGFKFHSERRIGSYVAARYEFRIPPTS